MSSYWDQRDFEIENGELVKYHGHEAVVHVPQGVVRIGEGAFTRPVTMAGFPGEPPPMLSWDGRENPVLATESYEELGGFEFIREVCLPEGVEEIGQKAFQMCKNLERVHLPGSLRRICEKAFARCYKLRQIEVPEAATIEYNAFFMTPVQIVRTSKKEY